MKKDIVVAYAPNNGAGSGSSGSSAGGNAPKKVTFDNNTTNTPDPSNPKKYPKEGKSGPR